VRISTYKFLGDTNIETLAITKHEGEKIIMTTQESRTVAK
jgi:hypothetical protein